jgi:hypothetical protein
MSGHSAHVQEKIIGVTHDPVLRPVGTLMAIVGSIWIVFAGMAAEAGTFLQPLLALALIATGVVLAGLGKPETQI